jgi:hypothetical protein
VRIHDGASVFDQRHADPPVWAIRFELDTRHVPRLVHRQSERGYTSNERDALPDEPEAIDAATLADYTADAHDRFAGQPRAPRRAVAPADAHGWRTVHQRRASSNTGANLTLSPLSGRSAAASFITRGRGAMLLPSCRAVSTTSLLAGSFENVAGRLLAWRDVALTCERETQAHSARPAERRRRHRRRATGYPSWPCADRGADAPPRHLLMVESDLGVPLPRPTVRMALCEHCEGPSAVFERVGCGVYGLR